jgi:chromosome partitioning protein
MRQLARDHARRRELEGLVFDAPESTRVITVANQKGGVGKTSTTVNLAAALAMGGLKVLVIDMDPQGNASTALGVDHQSEVASMYDVLVESTPLDEVVQEVGEVEGMLCAPATIDLSGAEIELVSMVARENRLRGSIRDYLAARDADGRERLDYVLIDCPPSLGLLTVNSLVAAREVLIPIQAEYYALEGLTLLLKNIDLLRQHLNPELVVSSILLTMYDARTRLAAQVAEDVRTHFPDQTFETTIPRSVRISEAPSYGQTVLSYDPTSSGALAYRAAAHELTTRSAP